MSRRKPHFPVVIKQGEDGWYVAAVPVLKGCHTQAKTLAELDERIGEAVTLCIRAEEQKSAVEAGDCRDEETCS